MKGIRPPLILVATLAAISCQSVKDNFGFADELSRETFKVEMVPRHNHQEIEEEIKNLVLRINSDISNGRYEEWLSYLSSDYIDNYNSSEVLNEISLFPRLKTRSIVLTDLKGYYEGVVVPSRYEIKLEDIEITTEKRAIVYSMCKGVRVRLYELEEIHGEWRITIWK